MNVCLFLCVFVTYSAQTAGSKGLKVGMWWGWTVGQFVGGCDMIPPHLVGVADKKQNWLCKYLLPIGSQTIGSNGLKFGMETGIDGELVVGGCDLFPPSLVGVAGKNKNAIFRQKEAEFGVKS